MRKSTQSLLYAFMLSAGLTIPLAATDVVTRTFKDRGWSSFEIETGSLSALASNPDRPLRARNSKRGEVELTRRLLVEVEEGSDIETVLRGRGLELVEAVSPHVQILQAGTVEQAMEIAEALGQDPNVVTARPVLGFKPQRLSAYAKASRDALYPEQWHLENRDSDHNESGPDLNIRSAWAVTRGAGVTIAVVDDGVDLSHPDLSGRAVRGLHYNFLSNRPEGGPSDVDSDHGTAVAGLAVATANNQIGVAGVAPEAGLASWVVLGPGPLYEDTVRRMYEFKSETIDVQNHSWGWVTDEQVGLSALEETGISRAFTTGRAGKGVVLVRAGGNDKPVGQNVNDEQAASDHRVIAVAAVRKDGRVTSYSEPGACVLVAAPSGDDDFPGIVTTDRLGVMGYNTSAAASGLPDYAHGASGFGGTSAAAPEIAGVAALILSTNNKLTVRDVQQILALSARHFDFADQRLQTNGAGLLVSDNIGYGVPDAGEAVRIAKDWPVRPALTNVTMTVSNRVAITERPTVEFNAAGLNPVYRYVRSFPSLGKEPRDPTEQLPLVYVGRLTTDTTKDLTGKAALIERGDVFFWEKIERAEKAGAAFAIIYNNEVETPPVFVMGATDYTAIPASMISKADGDYIRNLLNGGTNVTARLNVGDESRAAIYTFTVNDTLITEHVSLKLHTDHPRRSDIRVVVRSPSGTESVMQRRTLDDTGGPRNYTYNSVQHFFESSAGEWKVMIYDEEESQSGNAIYATLNIRGVKISDRDRDGLDDAWENKWFGNLGSSQLDDNDRDGYTNVREQVMGTSPTTANRQFEVDWTLINNTHARLSWHGVQGKEYRVLTADPGKPFALHKKVTGRFPDTELIFPIASGRKLIRIEAE